MKIKQKKLKAENFGYLRKAELRNTKKLLERMYMVDGDVAEIQNGIHIIFHLATYDGTKTNLDLSMTGRAFERIKEQIEIAYVILVKCELTPETEPFSGRKNTFFEEGNFLYAPEIPIDLFLQTFFGFKTRGQWGELLDVLISAVISDVPINDTIYQKDIVQSRFLLMKLPLVLREICQNRGIKNSIS